MIMVIGFSGYAAAAQAGSSASRTQHRKRFIGTSSARIISRMKTIKVSAFLLLDGYGWIINSPARRSPVLEAVLNGAHRSYVDFAPPAYPSAGAIGASLVVKL